MIYKAETIGEAQAAPEPKAIWINGTEIWVYTGDDAQKVSG